jgi:hypothetical protein
MAIRLQFTAASRPWRKIFTPGKLGLVPAVFLIVSPPPSSFAVANPPAKSTAGLAEQVRGVLAGRKAQLGVSDPEALRVFDSEVLPQALRFSKDLKSSSSGVSVDFDWVGIRNFIRVRPLPSGSQSLIAWNSGPGCSACASAAPSLKKWLADRMVGRSYKSKWDLGGELTASALQERAKAAGAQSYFVFRAREADVEVDTAHPDQRRLELTLFAGVKNGERWLETQKEVQLDSKDSILNSAESLWVDGVGELGSALQSTTSSVTGVARSEILIQARSNRDLVRFQQIRAALDQAVSGNGEVREARLSQVQWVWLIRSSKTAAELAKALMNLNAVVVDPQTIRIE